MFFLSAMATVWWYSHETTPRKAILRATKTLHDTWYFERSGKPHLLRPGDSFRTKRELANFKTGPKTLGPFLDNISFRCRNVTSQYN